MSQEDFNKGFIDCALWLAGREHDYGFYDLSDLPEPLAKEMTEDCEGFYSEFESMIEDEPERAGHDFYLTRNRHGAGFWDGDWPEAGDELTKGSHVYGSTDYLDLELKGDDDE